MKQIHISIVDRVATVLDTEACIDCSSGDEYQLIFTLDDEWSKYAEKTVKFMCGGHFYCKRLVDSTCIAPIIEHSGNYCLHVCAGVGALHTVEPAIINCIGTGTYRPDDVTVVVDATLTQSGQAADAKVTGDRIVELESDVADLLYKPIDITKFTNNVGTVEIGSTVTSVTFAWSFSKVPATVTLGNEGQRVDSSGVVLNGLSIKSNTSWTLRATDERGTVASKSTGVTFLNGVYYGASVAPAALSSGFILGLSNKKLSSSKVKEFSVDAAAGQHIYYCLPKRFGACEFSVGGFSGGFELAGTVSFKNASGYTEDYYVYKSVNDGLGLTTINVV